MKMGLRIGCCDYTLSRRFGDLASGDYKVEGFWPKLSLINLVIMAFGVVDRP